MLPRKLFTRVALVAVLASTLQPTLSARQGGAAGKRPDPGEFVKEIMALHLEGNQQHMAMWTPYEFFVAAGMSANDKLTAEAYEKEMGFLRSYITIFVMSSDEQPDGKDVYATEAETRRRAVLRLADGTEVGPLTNVPPKLSFVLGTMKSMIAAQGGADRESMHILAFPVTTAAGKTVVDSSRKDSLTLVLKAEGRFRENAFTWRTPFDATTNTPPCPKCKAAMSSKWSYCPYDGQKLP
jgi:hypothetical protein